VRVLALETSSSLGSIALVEAGGEPGAAELVASASARVSNAHGESLLPLVESVLRAARVDLSWVELLAVGIGPGSFTGTRIALATAKGIAIASGKPLRGIDAFAALAVDAGARGVAAVAIDARKSEVFVSAVRVGERVERLVEPAHLPPARAFAHLEAHLGADFVAVGDGATLVPELAAARRPRVGREVPQAFAVAALAAAAQLTAPIDEVDVLEPLYVRPPDVTLPTRLPGFPGKSSR
jgi:tRNA threonylcarbamoyladenosine biosynthesis protein TsaB